MAAVNRPPPAHPGPTGGNLHTHIHSGVPASEQQDPGVHSASHDPAPSSHPHPHISARPVVYVHAPPPAPFLHYQWPMPFPYNPFAGFPGMGYGMVMPPFPPPPYMDAPAYILPHPHIQPVDYRRLLHPPVHGPSALYQNPNQTRRTRLPHTVPVRETVNSEVQTEPTERGRGGYSEGSPLVSSESGHGTASSSPTSSSSSSQKQCPAQAENNTSPSSKTKDIQVKRSSTSSTVKHVLHPSGTNTVQSCIRETLEREYRRTQRSCKDGVGRENAAPCRTSHCNVWSVSSQDSMVPVCSSSQKEDEVMKERRISVPDILMSWRGSTPQETMLKVADKLPQSDHQLQSYETEVEYEKSVCRSPTKNGPVVAGDVNANDDTEVNLSPKESPSLFKVLKLREDHEEPEAESRREKEPVALVGSVRRCLPYRDEPQDSPNKFQKLPDNEQEDDSETNPHQDTSEIIPYQMYVNNFQLKRKMNESVWSVESLAPFIPTKEWLLQNSIFEPKVIVEMMEEDENGRPSAKNDNLIVKSGKDRRQTRRCSSSDSVPMSDSWLLFSTPAEKLGPSEKPEMESEIDASEMRTPKQGQSMAPSEKDPSISPTHLPSKLILSTPTEKDVDKDRSSEPEANQSPNQKSFIVNEQQEKSSSPQQEETLLLNSAAGENMSPTGQNRVDVEVEEEACRNEVVSQMTEQLCVLMADQKMDEVSPSKGKLVDCGVQCSELQERCSCEEMKSSMGPNRGHHLKYSDMKKANNSQAEGFCMKGNGQRNQKRNGHWRNRGQEKHSNQQDIYNGYCGKPGKSQGGNGRNPRY
ncbi:uncharacterized protein LOC117271443 [Epinephelus lanceolatus]|uniref:uncharacterized protein LOC117271443 n=1 Tax=Epinephelus lanceolatus TaxID=310571 RepID=UPI0014462ED6|nr:uncharacterized protein LOC117271443 [Epinephelus lanceolatus]